MVSVTVEVLRVFRDEAGAHGNPLGVVLDGPSVPESNRQELTAALDFSEAIFVDDIADGRIRIFTPGGTVPTGTEDSAVWGARTVGHRPRRGGTSG